jgi:hypothetical protein
MIFSRAEGVCSTLMLAQHILKIVNIYIYIYSKVTLHETYQLSAGKIIFSGIFLSKISLFSVGKPQKFTLFSMAQGKAAEN